MGKHDDFYKVLAEGMLPYLINRPDASLDIEGGKLGENE